MGKIHKHFTLGLLLLVFFTGSLALHITNITTDQSALLALNTHISKDPQQILAKNWTISHPVCSWIGVGCGFRHLRVTALSISNMNLTGTIPPQLGNLSFLVSLNMSGNEFQAELPEGFAGFRRLRVLDLSNNMLIGNFPSWIASLWELKYLSLAKNGLTGTLPPSISNMSKLATLSLSLNSLQGNIPAEVFNMSSLETIDFGDNSLSGSIPDNICGHSLKLKWLRLSRNKFEGRMPSSLGWCAQLQTLYISGNELSGEIPTEIGNLKTLVRLAMVGNKLQGAIPKTIGNMTMLQELHLGDNNLTVNGIYSMIPRDFKNLYNMEEIDFGQNKLTGAIPVELFNISTMMVISFPENQLSGNLPSTMGYGLPNLLEIYLYSNNFGGAIPDSISNSSYLYLVELSFNSFTGPIPSSIGDLGFLEILNLQNNVLTGDPSYHELSFITSLTNCEYLSHLGLNNNPLNGVLPQSIGNVSTFITEFLLYNCEIEGNLPNAIGNLSSVVTLDLSDNKVAGPLPNAFQDLQKLQRIDFSRNKIDSHLQLFCGFQNLGDLRLEGNLIQGDISECLGNLSFLRYLYLGSNILNSSLPKSLWKMKDFLKLNLSSNFLTGSLPPEMTSLKAAIGIDLSKNRFSGVIPSPIGEMESLQYLLLDHNTLQGSIPETFAKMLSLQALDVSHNFLSGSLPMSLEALQYLTYFDVSFNNLTGEIPSGGPFRNFTAESFASNEALCGDPRFHVPPCPRISTHKPRAKVVRRIVLILLGVMIVAVAICFGFVCLRYRRKDSSQNQVDLSLVTRERISYYELFQATNGYDQCNLLGTGSFGSVYKGTLDDGRLVAVKVFNLEVEGSFKSFDVECKVLCNLRHRNLAKVISSCSNPDFKALVLEYMPNGSLEKWLYSHNYFLNTVERLDILIDVACALKYLHREYSTPTVHCDLKPSNVLLDQDMVAHVSDFGVAKLLGHDDSTTHTKTLSTPCYLAPEYGMDGLVSTKCDVYSFGIMVMEVFTRKNPNDQMFGENLNIKSWVQGSMPHEVFDVIDANLLKAAEDHHHFPETITCISAIMEVALNCTKESPRERSNIQDVLEALIKIKLQLIKE